MPNDRFYIDSPLLCGDAVTLTSAEAQHLAQVMRGRVGQEVDLVNGRGVLAVARIDSVNRRDCELTVLTTTTADPEPCRLVIAQALPRMNRLDTILEKGTELGMQELWLFQGERSERDTLSNQQQIRVHNVTVAAMKQCGRLDLPKVEWHEKLGKWSPLSLPAFFGSLAEDAPSFSSAWHKARPKQGAIFFVGPEAGFSEHEKSLLQQWGAVGVKLHCNILRTDTAPLVALTLMSDYRSSL